MKILKSIKWRLQLWYGLILVVVLAGFGGTAYQLEYGRQMRRIDGELHLRFGIIANALREAMPPPNRPRFGNPPNDQWNEAPPPRRNPPLRDFVLPEWAGEFFDASNPHGYYYVISRDGHELARSTNAPVDDLDGQVRNSYYINAPPVLPHHEPAFKYNGGVTTDADFKSQRRAAGQPGAAWLHGDFREIITDLPSGEWIVIGKNITPELKELHRSGLEFTLIGGIILLFGLAGGGWFISSALRPISEISTTAVKIAAGDLSQRINVAEAESELGQLAAVLNSTFARLETAFAQQKQFAADAAHELRTPVSVMLTQTQTALNRERDAESYRQTVEACQRAAQRMRRLIESLLALARFDAGQEILKRMRFDFAKTISDSTEMVQTLAEDRNVKIVSEIAPLEITGDSERLAQVVTNLLTNAIQYNQAGGEVCVKLKLQNSLAVLEIADTGQGITPEDLPRVFERFYRADQSRTGAGNAGLGLSICKAIVEAHGGTMEVVSAVGKGSTFTVWLPV
jgi:two-component system, OmpR family, sensor kinase